MFMIGQQADEVRLGQLGNYIVSVSTRVNCGEHSQVTGPVRSNGQRCYIAGQTKLLSIGVDSPLGRAIREHNGFSVIVRITTVSAVGEVAETRQESATFVSQSHVSLARDLQIALETGECADVTLKSEDGDSFMAHRQLLAMRSPVLRAMFHGSMLEAQSGVAHIPASSPCVKQLLHFIYTDEIDASTSGTPESVIVELLELGTQYVLPRLVAHAKDNLVQTLSADNAAERLMLAMKHSVEELKNACEEIIRVNLSAVMRTEGWTRLAKDPLAMTLLIKSSEEPRPSRAADCSPRKVKRPRANPALG